LLQQLKIVKLQALGTNPTRH